jgi:membrane-bound lytic murein transglycosylase D
LKRDKFIDERIDPYKSTEAAIAYLKELHGMFGDWSTVLAAYNCGEGRVLRVIASQNINYLDHFWDLYERLPVETARYVPRFLATLHIVNQPEKYGLNVSEIEPAEEFETVEINRQVHLKDIARIIDMPIEDLKELNPQLRHSILPPERFSLKVTPEKGRIVLANLDRLPITAPPQRAFVWHKIRSGETLSRIARKYRTSINSIVQANNLQRSRPIPAGKNLKIPQTGYTAAYVEPVKTSTSPRVAYHSVKRGDSLWNIAQRYGTTTTKIQELNSLNSTRLTIGQVLRIAVQPSENQNIDNVGTYSVKRGDTPFTIARHHQMALERFLRLNKLTPRSRIYPGQLVSVE